MNCSATFRSRTSWSCGCCGKVAEPNGFCADHQWVHDRIMGIYNDAVKALSEPTPEDED